MPTSNTKMVRMDAEVVDLLKVTAAQRKTTVQALVTTAMLAWCRRQPEVRKARQSA